MSRAVVGPTNGITRNGPSGTPQCASVTPKSVSSSGRCILLAGSKKPSSPKVVLIASRPVDFSASTGCACSRSLMIVIGSRTLEKKSLMCSRALGVVTLR